MLKRMMVILALLMVLSGCDPYAPTTAMPQEQPTTALPVTSGTVTATQLPYTTVPTLPATVPETEPGQTQPHIHSYLGETVAPDCTVGGYTMHICACGDSFQDDFTDPLGHDWAQWQTIEPATVEKEGLQRRECVRCDAYDQQALPMLKPEHTHAYTVTQVEATCTTAGYTIRTCSCGDSYRDSETAALGHSWGQWITTKKPTQEAEGLKTRSCDRCNASDSQKIDQLPLAHTHTHQKQKVAATCTEGGYDLFTCACGDSYREETSQPKGHTWGAWTMHTAPTVNQPGQMVCRCEDCAEAMYQATEKLPSADGFVFVLLPGTVGRNEKATVAIIGQAGVTYDIDVYYKSGESSAKGLEDQVADEHGYVVWTWKIGPSTAAGTYRIEVTGNGVTQTIYFTVVV